nr:Rieske 2Fe-2S domain-containing protein [Tropheryma whipplei]
MSEFKDPGLPPHRQRLTDIDPSAAKRSERIVSVLFFLSALGSVWSIVAYFIFPIESSAGSRSVHSNNMFFGLGIAFSLLCFGIAAVHWAKTLMLGTEISETRHPIRSSDEDRKQADEIIKTADSESGFTRRTMIKAALVTALAAFPLPAIVLFRGFAPQEDPVPLLSHTMWKKGIRLVHDPTGVPIKASDLTVGSIVHVIPDGLLDRHDKLEQRAKAVVLLIRMPLDQLRVSPERKMWHYKGIVAYSKVCTHLGCPVSLYEHRTHRLLCPCHQSQFDISDEAAVVFGPAARPLPQLPITVDSEGYLIAQSDFKEPVGPSFWERSL